MNSQCAIVLIVASFSSSLHRMQCERSDRQGKAEISRLNAETSSLRQRLDRADADLLHSRRENLRLCDQISNLEKEVRIFISIA